MDEDVNIYAMPMPPVRFSEPAAEIRRDDRPHTIRLRISPDETPLSHSEPRPHDGQHPIHVPETSVVTSATSIAVTSAATSYAIVVLVPPKDAESNKIGAELKRIVFFVPSERPPRSS